MMILNVAEGGLDVVELGLGVEAIHIALQPATEVHLVENLVPRNAIRAE
jgi:hypothetical protein